MRHMNFKLSKLLIEGFSILTLENLNKVQLNALYERVVKSKSEVKEQPKPVEKTVTSKVTELPAGAKMPVGNVTVSNDNGVTKITQTEAELEDVDNVNKGQDDQDPIQKQGPDGMGEGEMMEKSVSKQQQKIMGLALSVKKGNTPKSKVSKKVKDMSVEMTKKELEDFASTKHKGLPKKISKKEEVKKLEESIMGLINNYLPPHTTKSELIRTIRRKL